MPAAIWVDGVLGGTVSPLDAGFLYGDSVFETMRVYRGRVIDREAHLDRFERARRAIAIEAPARDLVRGAVAETIAAAGDVDLRVRAIVTRGRTDLRAPQPLLVVTAEPCAPLEVRTIRLAMVDRPLSDPRTLDPSLKTGSYLPNQLALREAQARGCGEAVRFVGDVVASGASSNLFAVIDGALVTPPLALGIRDGVTRARVIELARAAGIEVAERRFDGGDLCAADESFVTSSIRGVAPVAGLCSERDDLREVDPLGPLTSKIAEAYLTFATRAAD